MPGTQKNNEVREDEQMIADFIIEDGVLKANEDKTYSGEVAIHSGVKKIDAGAFRNSKDIRKVIIPGSVTEIGAYAFEGCTGLECVEFGKDGNLSVIGQSAFQNCENLQEIFLPWSISDIGSGAFSSCTNLREVWRNHDREYISLRGIGMFAFQDCVNLKEFPFFPGIVHIEGRAFRNCRSLEYVQTPHTLKWIGTEAFEGCTGLKSVAVLGATDIYYDAFGGCSNLEKVELGAGPDKAGYVFDRAFANCTNLSSVEYVKPDGPHPTLSKNKFPGCGKLHTAVGVELRFFNGFDGAETLSRSVYEKRKREEERRLIGCCQHCGGEFETQDKVCKDCGKVKDY